MSESTAVAKIPRPPQHLWKKLVARSFLKLGVSSCVLSAVGSVACFYWYVIKRKNLYDDYQARAYQKEAKDLKWKNMVKMGCYRTVFEEQEAEDAEDDDDE